VTLASPLRVFCSRLRGPNSVLQRERQECNTVPRVCNSFCRIACTADCGAGVPPVSAAGTAAPQLTQLLTHFGETEDAPQCRSGFQPDQSGRQPMTETEERAKL
jgi:hypothetical protein